VNHDKRKLFQSRYCWLAIILIICFIILVGRVIKLTLFDEAFLKAEGNARSLRVLPLPAYRGMIKDRFGKALAVSVPVESIWINPKEFSLKDSNIPKLLKLLNENKNTLTSKIDKYNKKEFLYLKRHISPEKAHKILALKIPGVHAKDTYERYYPEANVIAPVIGFTNIDDIGQEGVELEYNNWLEGKPGKEVVVKDLFGHVVSVKGIVKPAESGKDIQLSIDSRAQYQAYSQLKKTVKARHAKSASMVILDVKTGEVIAMANYPSYNPNQRPRHLNSNYRNRAVTDVFEPGSTIKTFSVINALESGKYQPNTIIDTSPGWMYLDGKRVGDEINNGKINITTILQRSSNIGVTKLTLSLPPESLWQLLHKMGFGERTDSAFPGESSGELPFFNEWPKFTLATMSFGYGLSVTSLQLASAYATIANHGIKKPISLLKTKNQKLSKALIAPKVADDVMGMLESVVSDKGTGRKAQIPGYKVSGKTGTVRIVGPHGYEKNHHNAMFVGIVPASSPKFVGVVIVRDPLKGKYYGGSVAAPIFSHVMASVLRDYNVPPDNIKLQAG